MLRGGDASLENFIVSLNAVAPLFIIMAAGYLARLAGLLRSDEVPRVNSLVFRVFMPCLIFYNLYTSDLGAAIDPRLLLFAVAAVLVVFGLAAVIVTLAVRDPQKRGVIIQGVYRSNYVVIGLPIAAQLVPAGELGTITALIAVIVPIYNVLAVITLAVFRGGRIRLWQTVKVIVTNPLIVGAAAGILAQLVRLTLPDFLDSAVRDMAYVGSPMQLFLLGAFFRFDGLGKYRRELIWTTLARLMLVPGAVLPAAYALGFRGAAFVALIGLFASSNAVASFTMTQQMGGDDLLAGDIVVLTSALCPVTVFFWTLVYKSVGAF